MKVALERRILSCIGAQKHKGLKKLNVSVDSRFLRQHWYTISFENQGCGPVLNKRGYPSNVS